MTAGRPPSTTISTSRPSRRSSSATASALRATWLWSKEDAETLGMRTSCSRSARTWGMRPATRSRICWIWSGVSASSVTCPTLPTLFDRACLRFARTVTWAVRACLARRMDGSDRVREALEAVPRAGFLPRGARSRALDDVPILIGHGQTSSQPSTVSDMLRLLDVRPGHRVLDIGSGSGWTTALLAYLTGAAGEVLGLELEPSLAQWGAANLAGTRMPWATIREPAPGVLGDPE